MSKTHDPVKHLEYLRQSLSQDKKPIGIFISAGCPLSIEMPEGKWPLIPDVVELTKWVNKELEDTDGYSDLLIELSKASKDINNIEDILSFLRGMILVSKGGDVRGFDESKLNKLESLICNKIVEKINVSLPNTNTPYHRLAKWISSIDRDIPIEVFTTNYDMLLEESLEYLEVPYFDGFVGALNSFFDLRAIENNLIPNHWTRLWKVHGSMNWYQNDSNKKKNIYRSSEIKKDSSHLIYPSHLKYDESRKMPYLALIDQLSRFIRRKSSFLIISGYSFNDEHINDTIINALKANPSGIVIGLLFGKYLDTTDKEKPLERYPNAYKLAQERHNLNIWTFDKAIIGTNTGKWVKNKITVDNDILNYIDITNQEENPDQTDTLVKLGDFNVFSSFLINLVGLELSTNTELDHEK